MSVENDRGDCKYQKVLIDENLILEKSLLDLQYFKVFDFLKFPLTFNLY